MYKPLLQSPGLDREELLRETLLDLLLDDPKTSLLEDLEPLSVRPEVSQRSDIKAAPTWSD